MKFLRELATAGIIISFFRRSLMNLLFWLIVLNNQKFE
jgi:hypothetical protein